MQNWNQPPQIQPSVVYTGKTDGSQCDAGRASTGHSSSTVVCMADGSGKIVSGNVSQPTWQAALLPEDGLVPGSFGDW
jgi:hypothetical protein